MGANVAVEVGPVVVEFVVVFAFALLDFEPLLLVPALLFEMELLMGSRKALPKLLFDFFPFITLAMWWFRNLPFAAIWADKATDEKINNGDTTRIVILKIRCVALGFITLKKTGVRNAMMTI